MTEKTIYCQVHQFHEWVAVYVGGRTTYMTKDEARRFAEAMTAAANKDHSPTFELTIENHLAK